MPLEHGLGSLGTDNESVNCVSDGRNGNEDRLAAFGCRVKVRLRERAGDERRVEVEVGCEEEG